VDTIQNNSVTMKRETTADSGGSDLTGNQTIKDVQKRAGTHVAIQAGSSRSW